MGDSHVEQVQSIANTSTGEQKSAIESNEGLGANKMNLSSFLRDRPHGNEVDANVWGEEYVVKRKPSYLAIDWGGNINVS